jgi:hypothetical protein
MAGHSILKFRRELDLGLARRMALSQTLGDEPLAKPRNGSDQRESKGWQAQDFFFLKTPADDIKRTNEVLRLFVTLF